MALLELHSARLDLVVLSPAQAELESAYHLDNQQHLAPWSPLRPADYYSTEQVRLRLEQQAVAYGFGNAVHFALLEKASGQMIGTCNFTGIMRGAFQACYLGYSLAAAHQGRGLMHEALQTAIGHMFDELKLHRIMANYIPDNQRSAALLQRLGFEREGYARAYLQIAGRWQDHVLTARVNDTLM
jgi:ribosomal-protein-alanine N-acetyltransferase